VMPQTRWSAEAWSVVRVEFRRALAPLSQLPAAGGYGPTRLLHSVEYLSPLRLILIFGNKASVAHRLEFVQTVSIALRGSAE
jgi:hypothetical protein